MLPKGEAAATTPRLIYTAPRVVLPKTTPKTQSAKPTAGVDSTNPSPAGVRAGAVVAPSNVPQAEPAPARTKPSAPAPAHEDAVAMAPRNNGSRNMSGTLVMGLQNGNREFDLSNPLGTPTRLISEVLSQSGVVTTETHGSRKAVTIRIGQNSLRVAR